MNRVAVLCLIAVTFGCHKSAGDSGDPNALVNVKTAVATIEPFAETISAIGTVNARSGHIASLSPPAPARIAAVYVSQGQKVSVGTALVAFEQAPFVAAAQSAEAALVAAERNYERARRLAEAGIVPTKDADLAATELAQARAAASLARRSAQLATLRAPISGVVTKLNAPLGASMDPTQQIVEVADLGALDIIFNVSPSDAARIAPGASVTLSAGESAKGEPLGIGHITDVGGTVDSATRSVSVRALAPPTVTALVPDGDGFKVFVVTAGNIARARPVTVGRRTEASAEILSGLAAGERVVTEGAYGLEDSVKVAPAR